MEEEYRNEIDVKKVMEPVFTVPNSSVYQQTSPPIVSSTREWKYMKLLSVIQELGCHIKPFYGGRRYAGEEVKNCITNARNLVKDCILETQSNVIQKNKEN